MKLAVLGSPIAHSASPALHAAAYEVLGLDWTYGRAEVTADGLAEFVASLGPEWRGLSLTMPLKRAIVPLIARHDALVDRLGLANTVLLGTETVGTDLVAADAGLFNTDVAGIAKVITDAGVEHPKCAVVLGAGATAASALEALRLQGAGTRVLAARNPAAARAVMGPAATDIVRLDAAASSIDTADVVVSTLPGTAAASVALPHRIPGTPMLDVAYDPWPTALGAAWVAAGGTLLHGLDMLIEQAVLQVRIFVGRDPEAALPGEDDVRAAMRAAVGRPNR